MLGFVFWLTRSDLLWDLALLGRVSVLVYNPVGSSFVSVKVCTKITLGSTLVETPFKLKHFKCFQFHRHLISSHITSHNPAHINIEIYLKVLPFIRNQQCLIGVVDGSGQVRSFLQLIHQQSTYCYQTIITAMVWEWVLLCHGMSEHDVLNLESAQLYSGRERRPGEKRFKIPRYVKFLKDSIT